MSPEAIREGLAKFGGVKRRFTKTGEWHGVTIFDDYGHHPVEIAAVLRAARPAHVAEARLVMFHRSLYDMARSLLDRGD